MTDLLSKKVVGLILSDCERNEPPLEPQKQKGLCLGSIKAWAPRECENQALIDY